MNKKQPTKNIHNRQAKRFSSVMFLLGATALTSLVLNTPNVLAQNQEQYIIDWMPDITIGNSSVTQPIATDADDAQFKILGVGSLPQQRLTLTITPANTVPLDSSQELAALANGFWQPGVDNGFLQNAGLQLGWQLELRQATPNSLQPNLPVQADQPLATIQCATAQLTSGSYTGSGCRITSIEQQRISLVADWSPIAGLQTRVGMFHDNQNVNNAPSLLDVAALTSTLPNINGNTTLTDFSASGIQLGVSMQLSAGNLGNLAVNADLARVLDYRLSSPLTQTGFSVANLTNTPVIGSSNLDIAKLELDWSRGAFSGGVESIYQETPFLPGVSNGEDLTTFNVHFSWRTPWQGSLSIGATNLLDSRTRDNEPAVGGDLDSIYGRIPYVRYKQDL